MPNSSDFKQEKRVFTYAPVTYALKVKDTPDFYKQLAEFTSRMIQEAVFFLNKDILPAASFFSEEFPENTRKTEEIIIEYIALGIYIEKYASYAVNTGSWTTSGIGYLYSLRKRSGKLKPMVDNMRGILSAHLLYNKTQERVSYTKETVYKLVSWMKATGEFKEECERLQQWAFYLSTMEDAYVVSYIARCVAFSKYFEEQARYYLGAYTKGVNEFLKNGHTQYKYREDYLFCGRSEAEYHLNMFGAEILNRILKEKFDNTDRKILLLPTCMSKPAEGLCKAREMKNYHSCTSCTPSCRVHQIKQEMKSSGCETILMSHSSDYSEFLKSWQNQESTGLIGVACILNLISGGYEMQKYNIPSQCVFLDYPGCKKHWHSAGIPTDLDTRQLNKILEPVKAESIETNA